MNALIQGTEQITTIREFLLTQRTTEVLPNERFLICGIRTTQARGEGWIAVKIGKWDFGGLPLFWLDDWFDLPNALLVTKGDILTIETDRFPLNVALRVTIFRDIK